MSESSLRRKIREILIEAEFIRKRTGQRVQSGSAEGPKASSGMVEFMPINPDRLVEGVDVPVILAIIDDVKRLDAYGEEAEEQGSLSEPTKFFVAFARPGFRDKYLNSLEVPERAELRSFAMSYGDVEVGELTVEVVHVRLSDIFGTFDAGRVDMLKRQELRALKAERDRIKGLSKSERTAEDKERFLELKELFAIAKQKYADLEEDMSNRSARIYKKDLQNLQRVHHSSTDGQYYTSVPAREAIAIALRPFDLVSVEKEIKSSDFLSNGGERTIIRVLNDRRFFETMEQAGYDDAMSEDDARNLVKRTGGTIRGDLDLYAGTSRKKGRALALGSINLQLDEEVRVCVEAIKEGSYKEEFGFGFSAILKAISLKSSYADFYDKKAQKNAASQKAKQARAIRGSAVVDADDLMPDDEFESDSDLELSDDSRIDDGGNPSDYRAYHSVMGALEGLPMREACLMFRSAILECYKYITERSKTAFEFHGDIQVDSSGNIVGLDDKTKVEIYGSLLENLRFLRDTLHVVVGQMKKREAALSPRQKEMKDNPQLAPDKPSRAEQPHYQNPGEGASRQYRRGYHSKHDRR